MQIPKISTIIVAGMTIVVIGTASILVTVVTRVEAMNAEVLALTPPAVPDFLGEPENFVRVPAEMIKLRSPKYGQLDGVILQPSSDVVCGCAIYAGRVICHCTLSGCGV